MREEGERSIHHAILNSFNKMEQPMLATSEVIDAVDFSDNRIRDALEEMEDVDILGKRELPSTYVWYIDSPVWQSPNNEILRREVNHKLEGAN